MKITCLVDDCAREGVGAEHGLSLWVEACGKKLLFDSGASGLFLENAARLGIDVADADFAVLSHAHYDHGGGLAAFLEANSRAKVYVRAGAFAPRYARRRNGRTEYIGIDAALAGNGRVVETGETCALAPGLTLFSGVRGRELFRARTACCWARTARRRTTSPTSSTCSSARGAAARSSPAARTAAS